MFDFDKISASKFYVAPTVERVVEFSPPGIDMDNITKVLSLAVEAKCNDATAYEGYAQVNGRTSFRLTYLDRQGAPKGVDYNADFSVRVEGEFRPEDSVSCDIRVLESDVQAGGGLQLSAVLEVEVSAIRREELEVLADADKCYKTVKNISLPTYIAAKNAVSQFEDECEVGGEITSVLGLSTNVSVKRAQATDGGVIAEASLYATVTYVEGAQIKQKDFKIDLDEELGLDGVESTDKVCVSASVKSSKVVLQGVTDDNIIKVEGEVYFKVQVFRLTKVSVVDDLFTLTNEVSVERSSAKYAVFDGCGFFTEHVSGTAMLGDNRAAALEIAALPYARCYTSKAFIDSDGLLVIEGIVNTDVIYVDENGYNSVRTEIPFALSISSEKPFSENVKVRCTVLDISARIRREREIELDLRLGIEVCGYSSVSSDYISAVELGDEKPQNTSAISLYIARGGDELLDLCKALTAMPEDIISQNPALEFPLREGERVVFFRHIDM